MKTLTDLRLEYKRETGLEVILTAYGFRPYLAWLEERLLKELNKTMPAIGNVCPRCGMIPKWGMTPKDTELPSER